MVVSSIILLTCFLEVISFSNLILNSSIYLPPSSAFEEAYATLRRLDDSKTDLDRVPTVDERIQLSYDIFKLDNTEMARVLTIIEEKSPNSLSHKAKVDEVLINIDALNPRCFHEVNSFVLSCIMNQALAKGKRKKPEGQVASSATSVAGNSKNSKKLK